MNPFFAGKFFNGGFFGFLNRGDWQVFYHDKKKRWKKETLDREALRAIIRKAVLREVPAVVPYVAKPQIPSDTAGVKRALAPAKTSIPLIAYDRVMADIAAIQKILTWHYRRPVEVTTPDDDDDAIMVLML